jgi:RNA polymerase sigma-70 factor (ECF subfamily)
LDTERERDVGVTEPATGIVDRDLPDEGTVEVFAALVREHQAMVYSLAHHFLRDPGAAEELAQEVFLQLYEHLEDIESLAHAAHWLRRVTSHRCIDRARRRSHRPEAREVQLTEVVEPRSPAESSDPLLAGKLRKLVASLPEKPRMVVILHFQEDLDAAEIASVLNMPVSTVRSHLQRALVMLREKAARTLGDLKS